MNKQYAEHFATGDRLRWATSPNVAPRFGELPFAAPGTIGVVHGFSTDGRAIVRFQYKNPTGGMSWSDPIEVLPGQACSVEV